MGESGWCVCGLVVNVGCWCFFGFLVRVFDVARRGERRRRVTKDLYIVCEKIEN